MAFDNSGRQGTLSRLPMKHISLLTLVFQNSMLILIMHYSRIMPAVNGQRYYTSTAVFLNEVMKLAVSLIMALYEIATSPNTQSSTVVGLFGELSRAVFAGDSWKLAIPAVLYTLQNTLQYVGVSNLDAATFQVTYQLKILTTALFSVTLLGRSLSVRRWFSLVLLMAGVAIVQVPADSTSPEHQSGMSIKTLKDGVGFHSPKGIFDLKAVGKSVADRLSGRSATYEGIDKDVSAQSPEINASIGLMAVIIACMLSGLAGVYFEKILKKSNAAQPVSVWIRNVQLSFYSLWPALFVGVLFKDGEHIAQNGFFAGYNWVVWLAITLQAMGGIVVALVINYADNLAKNFATSISIIVSFLASVYFFNFKITPLYVFGTFVVLAATYIYNTAPDGKPKPQLPPINVTDTEKDGEESEYLMESQPSPEREGPSTKREEKEQSTRLPASHFKLHLLLDPHGHLMLHHHNMSSWACSIPSTHHVLMRYMDDRIFAQLDRLERGARKEEARRAQPDYSSTSAYHDGQRKDDHPSDQDHIYDRHDGLVNQPLTLDSSAEDERLLRLPDQNSRQVQAAQGHGRLSLAPAQSQLPGLQRFVFDPSSSSACEQPVHSSPAFKASQRRPAAYDAPRILQGPGQRRPRDDGGHASSYRPLSVEQLEEEERVAQAAKAHVSHHPAAPSTSAQSGRRPVSTPKVQGIHLISTHELPDRFRAIFPFPLFNRVQSKCFDIVYRSDDNFVLSSPTGSGKTAVLELAICRLIHGLSNGSYKVVYQAPTKSLCSERQRDWQAKFGPLDLQCAELTGDTDSAQLRNVQHASIIVTTPEKWDSMTRKWKDHQKLMQMIKLMLIDEVHILKEDRGATLEAVVSRMKSIGSDVRFVALSATVPNYKDIATWLGRSTAERYMPAVSECFGEEFRPVKLLKHVCGYPSTGNDFAFEKMLDSKLIEVITRYSHRKPIMIFCFTRKSCVSTAKLLASWWAASSPANRYWSSPRSRISVVDRDLQGTMTSGVAFHHAGMNIDDRLQVEKSYLAGEVGVICCTSTLAVGVNLPCHMAIIKGTVTYASASGVGCVKEYSDLEIMQMLGRAGRPQFDDSAVAVIMTRTARVEHYEKMISGQEILESCLHRNLIDHLNAEIGLGTIASPARAKTWLSGTFLYVRLQENPEHYKLNDDVPGRSLEERLEHICAKAINMLEEHDLVKRGPKLQCTEFGEAMARYYLQFDTMKIFLALPPQAKVSEILSAIAQAREFGEIRFRAGEKSTYKDLNKNLSIKFPIPVNLDPPAHKVSLVIQSVLGAIDLPTDDYNQRNDYITAKSLIFQHAHRLVRCIVDCQLHRDDAIASRNALMLARSLGAQVWDDSPLHIMQLDGVGPVYVRKLVNAGIKSIQDIELTDAHRLETVCSRNPPYGTQLQAKARAFPNLMVSLKAMGQPKIVKGQHVSVHIKAEIAFLNDKVPDTFQKRPVYVCLLAETSEGHKIHFVRSSAKRLSKAQEVLFDAKLTLPTETIRAYVMCDEIAGTARHAVLQPDIPASAFPPPKTAEQKTTQRHVLTSKRRASAGKSCEAGHDEFGDADLNDDDFAAAEAAGFVDIDDLDDAGDTPPKKKQKTTGSTATPGSVWEPRQLSNGKWACNHLCSDKNKCKHLCCRQGLDKKPRPPKSREAKQATKESGSDPKQTQLTMGSRKAVTSGRMVDLPAKQELPVTQRPAMQSKGTRKLADLYSNIETNTSRAQTIAAGSTSVKPAKKAPDLGFLHTTKDRDTSDYGLDDSWDAEDLPSVGEMIGTQKPSTRTSPSHNQSYSTGDSDMLDEGDDGAAAYLQPHQPGYEGHGPGHVDPSSYTGQQAEPWDTDNDDGLDDVIDLQQPTELNDQASQQHASSDGNKRLFVTDSAASEQKPDPYYDNAVPIPAQDDDTYPYCDADGRQYLYHRADGRQQSTHSAVPRTASAQLHDDLNKSSQGHQQTAVGDDGLTPTREPRPPTEQKSNADDLEAWFKAQFGEEHFTYVG
ncbi:ATP-dependent DNA helicase MER3 [Teratosphaeria destructans]|uniref:DNA 3'-5' helicase n=1 Tax=Teratosphaeria destructans TaxID=418781 RepID=A0A9W7SK50_9PEZI|nr:ATP-dependent DNA helicase MER3 [Teratosphaeria destructans]